jgi:hypothetical protein
MNGCIVKGKLLMEALKMALRQLEEHPDTFVNLCDVAMIDDADEDDDLDMVGDVAWEYFLVIAFSLLLIAFVRYFAVLVSRDSFTSRQKSPPPKVPEMQRVLEQQQMNMPTITLKDSEGTSTCPRSK